MTTGYVYDPIFLKHKQVGHPERPERLESIITELTSTGLRDALEQIPSRAAPLEELTEVHSATYVQQVKEVGRHKGGYLDADTYTNQYTYSAAVVAAGSLIDLTQAVIKGHARNGFALVRPPGHHATPSQAKGFCIFSNVGLTARIARHTLDRVAIVDFDVHHGNGTQDIVEADPNILFISSHQYPFYPGTGSLYDLGPDVGEGSTINLPLSASVGDAGFRAIYEEVILPALHKFAPDLILVSAGYDAHWQDPLAALDLTLSGCAWISQALVEAAETLCEGKIVFSLEGGYDLDVLAWGVTNSFKAMLGRTDFSDLLGLPYHHQEPDLSEYLGTIKKIHEIRL